MKGSIYDKLHSYVLPGRDPKEEFQASVIFGIIWAAVGNVLKFFVIYYESFMACSKKMAEWNLNLSDWAMMYVMDGQMPPLQLMTNLSLWGVHVYVIYRVLKAIYDTFYFTRDSKSVYLVKRLDEAMPVARRCWTKALAGIAAALLTGLILFGLNWLIYTCLTPAEFSPDTAGATFWGALFGGAL